MGEHDDFFFSLFAAREHSHMMTLLPSDGTFPAGISVDSGNLGPISTAKYWK